MDSQEVGALLDECLKAATGELATPSTQGAKLDYCRYRDLLCVELSSLLQEAVCMKWPFVPEKWQYKQSIHSHDKANLTDLISQHLAELLALLKAAILAREPQCAVAVIFLVDRFIYWTDESSQLLKITMRLHRLHPNTPVAPQLVIRQARVYLNAGKLQKAEFILSMLINNSGATGCWVYQSESDRALVQAVSVQVRGLVLQKLGLWSEAAELIWASLIGYYALPQPDKKGIGTSLGILANILVSMNEEDFSAFKSNSYSDLSILGNRTHRLLAAAEAAKMAVVYSQYASLYVLTNVVSQGTCLLSYSFSMECPAAERHVFLLQAKEAFEIGLLTKTEGEPVSSKQELHTFIKAAYSLGVTHKWLGTPLDAVVQATQACQEAMEKFYTYCHAETRDRDSLSADIMHLVARVKTLFRIKLFPNSNEGSFIPDSYRNVEERPARFTLDSFSQVIGRFRKYHASVCGATEADCSGKTGGLCITAMGTTVRTLPTDCTTENQKTQQDTKDKEPIKEKKPCSSFQPSLVQGCDLATTLGSAEYLSDVGFDKMASKGSDSGSGSSLGSSWQNVSPSCAGSPHLSSDGHAGNIVDVKKNTCHPSCLTTDVSTGESHAALASMDKGRNQGIHGPISDLSGPAGPSPTDDVTSPSHRGSDVDRFEMLETEEDWVGTDAPVGQVGPTGPGGVAHSLSQLNVTSSNSLNDSFGSQSSWEKISSSEPLSPDQPRLPGLSQPATGHGYKPPAHCGSGHPANQPKRSITPPGPGRPTGFVPEQYLTTETSTDSSFEMIENNMDPSDASTLSSTKPISLRKKNTSCYSCLKHSLVNGVVPQRQYVLTQQDYKALLAGVCHQCLMERLQSDRKKFKLEKYRSSHSALHVKFSRATGLWTAKETCVYVGEEMGQEGQQRAALWVQFLHQEERLSSYVGKDYRKPTGIQFHLRDVERQMTSQYYVTEFNKRLYDKEVTAQIFFIPSEVLLLLQGDEIVGCVTAEPFMLGDFVKLTNNTGKKVQGLQATEYGIAFGHFTYLYSECTEVVVDLQGWATANEKGLTYLTDPQIHSIQTPKGPSNFAERGLRYFLEDQHGPECNTICNLLKLPPMKRPKGL
ncbi:alpha-protein kinase 1 [Aplochiton taeniatus]